MTGKKKRTVYRKTRKRKGHGGDRKKAQLLKKSGCNRKSEPNEPTPGTSHDQSDLSDFGEESDQLPSSSRKKMRFQSSEDESSSSSDENKKVFEVAEVEKGYRLVDLKSFSSVLSTLHKCEEGDLTIEENTASRYGLMSDLSIHCNSCDESTPWQTSPNLAKKGKSFDVNRRAVYHSIETGSGYEGLSSFCAIMNMPCLSRAAYYKQVDVILEALESEAKEELKGAGQRLRKLIMEENGISDSTTIIDAAVSFDGTWAKRGFTSLTGVVFVISIDTGEVLDYHVMSKSCRHVQKRMGKHLMNLKACSKGKLADGKPIGGRGRLTEGKIKQLQRYYGLAIRQNTLTKANPSEREVDIAVYAMKKNIIAILHHCVNSTDNAKQHRFCPPGDSSWCKWQQDQATGTSTYKGDDCLPEVFVETLKPTFVSLSDSKLLERCVRGKTQNPNESINAMVWVRCPKHKHHGVKVVRCAAASAVCHFHRGAESRERLMERLSIPGGAFTEDAFRLRDNSRLRKADKQATAKEKKRRQGLQLIRTQREAALREKEDVLYEAGAF
ncbi:hypothetical protein AWC38_SpisGene25147 [Stylophora pistillata]|uniref:Mutator-like transposase domain-containing protein n=1 Tax=Stylophora pistillata TaxID=50429 RepID=A0A2B4R231_STYPI|nr:hypothetical protein AWC38_SpisGene25147 [Stylophora pistillata]